MAQAFGVVFKGCPSPLPTVPQGEGKDTPLVQVLDARVGKGESAVGGEALEVCITAVFKKYTTLEDTTFAFFKRDRRNFYLHFHAENHDRCETRLKPRLWDNGAYFRPEPLKEGALRIIPHFLPQVSREETSRKRPAPSLPIVSPMTFSTPTPQKRRQEQTDPALSSPVDTTMESSTPIPQKRRQEEPCPITPAPHYYTALVDLTVDSGDDELDEQEAFEQAQALSNQQSLRGGVGRGHGRVRDNHDTERFKPAQTSTLPTDATYYAWLTDITNAKARYITTHHNGVTPKPRSSAECVMSNKVHAEMIGGKYGMTALKPCGHCIETGTVCRVYHPDCYKWHVPGRSSYHNVGWRCQLCRNSPLRIGGCNAQFDE